MKIQILQNNFKNIWDKCPECNGLGGIKIFYNKDTLECCFACGGSGLFSNYEARKNYMNRLHKG